MQDVKPAPAQLPTITKFSDLISLSCEPMDVHFFFRGRECKLPLRKLNVNETDVLKGQLDEALPPIIKGKTEAEDRFNYTDKIYMEKKMRIERSVRCQALLWASADLQDEAKKTKPEIFADPNVNLYDSRNRQNIEDFFKTILTDDLQSYLYSQVLDPSLKIAEKVNFT